jgi:L-fuconolactonase
MSRRLRLVAIIVPNQPAMRPDEHGHELARVGVAGYSDDLVNAAWRDRVQESGASMPIEIVDAQVHLNRLGADWQTIEPSAAIDRAVIVMNAAGIDAVLVDEFERFDEQWNHHPGYVGPHGVWRFTTPYSERAVAMYPDRFAFVARVHHLDPEIDALMAAVRAAPGAVCIRVVPHPRTDEVQQFVAGAYAELFAAAGRHQVPVMAWLPGRGQTLVPYLEGFPETQFILDHTGVSDDPPGWSPTRRDDLRQVVELARYPNLALKWSRAPERFSNQDYPFGDVLPFLRMAIDAFGVRRLLWATDYTQSQVRHSWAEACHYILNSDALTSDEKEWLLGTSARTLLGWPRPAPRPRGGANI